MVLSKPKQQAVSSFASELEIKGRSLWQDAARRFFKNRAALASLIILSLISLLVILWVRFAAASRGGLRLEAVPPGRFVLVFLRQLAIVYIASGVAVTALALAIIYAITRSGPNALALAVLAGLWLSLWLAPGIASFTTWRTLRGAGADDPKPRA